MRFIITSGTTIHEIIDWRSDAKSAHQHVMHLISLKKANIRVFDPDGHRVTLEKLRDLAGRAGGTRRPRGSSPSNADLGR
jgi:hypothetical protein